MGRLDQLRLAHVLGSGKTPSPADTVAAANGVLMTKNMQPESAWLLSRHAIGEAARYLPALSLREIEARLIRAFRCGDIPTIRRESNNDGVVTETSFDRSDWRFVETLNPTMDAWIAATREMGKDYVEPQVWVTRGLYAREILVDGGSLTAWLIRETAGDAATNGAKKKKSPGHNYREADAPIVEEMHRGIEAGTYSNRTTAADALASKATGGGNETSKKTRLIGRYSDIHGAAVGPTQGPG